MDGPARGRVDHARSPALYLKAWHILWVYPSFIYMVVRT